MNDSDVEGFRRLAHAVVLDAVDNVRNGNQYSRESESFLAGRSGNLDFWLDTIPNVDRDSWKKKLNDLVEEEKNNPKTRRRSNRKRIMVKYRDGTEIWARDAAQDHKISYGTFINRHHRFPNACVEDLVEKVRHRYNRGDDRPMIMYRGERISLMEGAKLLGMNYQTIYYRWLHHPEMDLDTIGLEGRIKFMVFSYPGMKNGESV